jgi:hypothetical protein
MARQMNAAWIVAIGAGLLMMTVQAHGAAAMKQTPAQKPATPQTATQQTSTTQKPAVQKTAPVPKVPMTTMTGCLKMDGNQYQLTNVEGARVEKGRSWKTGFITKSTKNVQVDGASSSVRLKDQVGHKVSVVGTQDTKDGETHLRASSIKRVSASCS